MPNEIYHRSNWGNANAGEFGDVYFDAAATNKLYNHSDYYENSDGTDKILRDIPNKASIVLTPTAYSDGSLNTVIPPYQVLPTELVTNGDFSDGTNGWTINGDNFSIVDGALRINRVTNTTYIQQNVLTSGKKYKVEFDVLDKVDNNGTFIVRLGSNNVYGVSNYEGTRFSKILTSSGIDFRIYSSSDNGVIYIDNVSVKEIQEADFDFTRGSSATRVNEQGLIEDVQILSGELVTNGTFDTDIDWSATNSTISISNGVCQVNPTAIFGYLNSTSSFQTGIGKKYVYTFYCISRTGSGNVYMQIGTSQNGNNVTNQNLGNIEDNTSYSITFTATSTTSYLRIGFGGSGTSATIDNISIKEITDDTDLPRIDYSSGFGSLLLEPQRTNKITYSEDFSQWSKTGTTSVSSNDNISPDGTQNASTVSGLTGSGSNDLYLITGENPASKTYSFSVYLKGEGTLRLQISNNVNQGISETVTLTSDWKRHIVTGTFNSTSGTLSATLDDSGATATEYKIWGAQLEEGSYPTSYIVSNSGSATTRSADVANNSGNADLINSTEGVLYAEIAALADDGTYSIISLSDNSSNNFIIIGYKDTTNRLFCDAIIGGTRFVSNPTTIVNQEQFNKICLKYKSGDTDIYFNGFKILSSSTTFTHSGNPISELEFSYFDNSLPFYGKTKELAVFKEALTDAELESLTSWVSFTEMATDLEYTLE
jgi:hypothetical protein